MDCQVNQAVVFTKPLHHLGLSLTPEQLDRKTRSFLEEKEVRLVYGKRVAGSELAERQVMREHYLMYSRGSYGEAVVTDLGRAAFESAFGQDWDSEVEAGRIMGNPRLMQIKGISAHELYLLWNERFANRQAQKIQDGVIVAWLKELGCYCINAFYPAMEENFYHSATDIGYHVVEFNPSRVSWAHFRKEILGLTDASKADPDSFRGRLYAEYPIEFPTRDNFVHGSAGPVEGVIERMVHEPDFEMAANPVGRYLAGRGMDLGAFKRWKAGQTIGQLGRLFGQTEEKNCSEALAALDSIRF